MNDVWKMREREIGERKIFKGTPGDFRAQKEEYSFLSILVAFFPNQSSCNASNPATSSNMGLYESNARRVYMCGCVCVGGREEGIFTDSSIYAYRFFHASSSSIYIYNVLCTIKTRTQQQACSKKEGEERER